MRKKIWRIFYTGLVLLVAAIGFFLYMASIASHSNDPKALMEIVGQVSGGVGAIALAMMAFGLIGKKT